MDPTPTAAPLDALGTYPGAGSIITLFVVLAVLVVAAYFTTRFVGGKANRFYRSKHIQILDRLNIARDKSVMIIRAGEKNYMLGVTQQSISCLDTIEGELSELETAKVEMPGWMQRLFEPRQAVKRDAKARQAPDDALDAMEQLMRIRAERQKQARQQDKERDR